MEEEIKNEEQKTGDQPGDELALCQKKCDEYLNNWKRERADFLNYKKEEIERIGLLAQYTKEETILKMLPILDSIYLAEKQMPDELKNHQWIEGFLQTKQQIDTFLAKEGIEKIEAIDKSFDPNTMEAMEAVENPSDSEQMVKQPNIVVEELQRGYMLNNKVLRPAKVKITK